MNLLQMRYAVKIAETNSINKAADQLYVGQSALSRAIKELETSLGAVLFERSPKGMFLTPDGELFVNYASKILRQVDSMDEMFKNRGVEKSRFSVSVPRASYITEAFVEFSKHIGKNDNVEIFYKETNSMRTLKNILKDDYRLGILRYAEEYSGYYDKLLTEKNINGELVSEFTYRLLMSRKNPLSEKEEIVYEDLRNFIEVAHADPYVPSLPLEEVKKTELPEDSNRRIFVFERGSQFELLSENTETYMWVSPIPKALLERYGLVERECRENRRVYRDVLIRRSDRVLSEYDKMFIDELIKAKRKTMK